MFTANSIGTPMVSGSVISAFGGELFSDVRLYRQIVGALQYATITRPEITYCVNKVCQFMHAPTLAHWQAVKRILHYLKGSFSSDLLLKPPTDLRLYGYADTDWASDPNDRKSTSGFCIFFGENLVAWGSKKQSIISRSSTEAEFRSIANTSTELLWLQALLTELQISTSPPILWCDNLGAVHLSANPVLHSRTKHVELDIYFVLDLVL